MVHRQPRDFGENAALDEPSARTEDARAMLRLADTEYSGGYASPGSGPRVSSGAG